MSRLEWLSMATWLFFVGYASLVFDVHFFTWRGIGLYVFAIGYGISERLVGRERA